VLEAIRQQRNAAAVIGHDSEDFLDYDQRITAARIAGAPGDAVLLRGDPPELPHLLADQAGNFLHRHRHFDPGINVHPGGSADLIVVSLPAVLLLGRRQDHTRTWHARFSAFDVLTACQVVLRPGGYLVAVTGGDELEGAAHDLGSTTVSLCSELGLRYWQHIICLLAPIEGGELKPRRRRRRRRSQTGLPRVVHQNVHVFRKPDPASAHERWPL
jgi:hypothetical protein